MSWDVGMPNLGHTMEEGKLSEWLKPLGSSVVAGEVIATVESDKASFDVEAPANGTLLAINVPAGTMVRVGTIIGVVGEPGEPSEPSTTVPAARARQNATPAARKLAAELGIDLAAVTGTGDAGSIGRDDVRAYAATRAKAPSAEPPASQSSLMRRAIARATEQAWRTIPHVTLIRRAVLPVAGRPGNITALVLHAAARALRRHPRFNGWWTDDGSFRPTESVDVGVAMAAGGGLRMPSVRAADTKTVAVIAEEIAALAEAARSGSLDGAQSLDASFSITSLGRWGVEAFTPIINAPQVAILGVGAIDRVAREAPDGSAMFRSELYLCLVFDHRANDGVEAAEFLADIATNLAEDGR